MCKTFDKIHYNDIAIFTNALFGCEFDAYTQESVRLSIKKGMTKFKEFYKNYKIDSSMGTEIIQNKHLDILNYLNKIRESLKK